MQQKISNCDCIRCDSTRRCSQQPFPFSCLKRLQPQLPYIALQAFLFSFVFLSSIAFFFFFFLFCVSLACKLFSCQSLLNHSVYAVVCEVCIFKFANKRNKACDGT